MKNTLLILVVLCGLFGCKTNDQVVEPVTKNIQYLDFTDDGKEDQVKNYWKLIKHHPAQFPVSAARNNQSGCTELIVGISSEGKINGYKVSKSYPKGVFDSAAAAALTKWRWLPTEANAEAVPILIKIQIDFVLSGSKRALKAMEQCGSENIKS